MVSNLKIQVKIKIVETVIINLLFSVLKIIGRKGIVQNNGWLENAFIMSPDKKDTYALVNPHPGQGILSLLLNKHRGISSLEK